MLRGILPGIVSLLVFVGIEWLFARRYGSSHFLWLLRGQDQFEGHDHLRYVLFSAIPLVGGVGGPLALLMLLHLGASHRWLMAGTGVIVAAFALTAAGPMGLIVFVALGVAIWAVYGWVTVQFVRGTVVRGSVPDDLFLIGWLGIELLGFVAISPFGATRRLFMLLFVLALVTARLLDPTPATPGRRRSLHRLIAFAGTMGFAFFAVDYLDASAMRTGARSAAAVIDQFRTPGQRAYYKGHWGFQFYCENAGIEPVVPDHTVLHRGDWFVYPNSSIAMQSAVMPLKDVAEVATFVIDDPIALETEPAFYGRYVPMDHRAKPRFDVTVYQATADFVPKTNLPAAEIIDWAITRPRPMPPEAVSAVLAAMKQVARDAQKQTAKAIIAGGADTLIEAAKDVDPRSRRWAAVQLGKMPKAPAVVDALRVLSDDAERDVRNAAAKSLGVDVDTQKPSLFSGRPEGEPVGQVPLRGDR